MNDSSQRGREPGLEESPKVRIYAESIEQGEILFVPVVSSSFAPLMVELSRMPRKRSKILRLLKEGNRTMAGIFDLANPDGIITVVEKDREIAVATIEISDAVKTEDHEMQRYPQICSAMAYDMIHLKISSHQKKSLRGHGGNVDFDPLTIPRILRDEYDFRGAYLLDWPTGDNEYVLKRNPDAMSCPADGAITLLPAVLNAISATVQSGCLPEEGTYNFVQSVWENFEEASMYDAMIENAPSRKVLLKGWNEQSIPPHKGYLRKRMDGDDEVLITIPRFEKDSPGPGEVMGYAMMSKARTVGIAYCGRDRSMRIDSKHDSRSWNSPCNSIHDVAERFFDIFSKTSKHRPKDKMPVELLELLKQSWKKNKNPRIDITQGLKKLAESGKNAKWVITFVFFADYLMIHDRPLRQHPITFHWDREAILGISVGLSMDHLRNYNYVDDEYPMKLLPSDARPVHNGKEDFVTWVSAQVLKKLGWVINAISYPGAQGDGAMLPGGKKSLARKRTYVDVLCSNSDSNGPIGMLLEAKDKESKIGPDLTKLQRLVEEEAAAIQKAFSRLGVHGLKRFYRCVAFGVEEVGEDGRHFFNKESLRVKGVDFAFTVSDADARYEMTDLRTNRVVDSGPLPLHSMHSLDSH